jgi:hypothetical protein
LGPISILGPSAKGKEHKMDWLVQAFPEAIGGLIVIAVVSAIGWLWRRSRRTHKEQVGLVAIYEDGFETRRSTLEEATRSFWFMGLSAQYVCSEDQFREIIRTRRGCQYRFLLLNPDSEYVEDVEHREDMGKKTLASYIRASIEDLMDIHERSNPNIEVKLYSERSRPEMWEESKRDKGGQGTVFVPLRRLDGG